MAHWAKPGVKCVCVRALASWERLPRGHQAPKRGQTYTIREVFEWKGKIGIRLVEIVNPIYRFTGVTAEAGWGVDGFRPLITRTQEQDVELFAPLLDTANHRDLERV